MAESIERKGSTIVIKLSDEELERLALPENARLEAEVSAGSLHLYEAVSPGRRMELKEAVERCFEQYGDALRRLGE